MYFLISVFALVFGSFNTVLVTRIPKSQSIGGRSSCQSCQAQIPFYFNVPVISFIMLRGKCRNCHSPISKLYPFTEIATLLITLLITMKLNSNFAIISGFIFSVISVALIIIDWREHRLPNSLTYTLFLILLVISFLQSLINRDYALLKRSLIASVVLVLFYLLINLVSKGGMGMGDVKYGASIGIFTGSLGYTYTYVASMSAFFIGSLYGIALMVGRKANRKSKVPFGPFMFLGVLAALYLVPALPSALR